MALAMEVEMAAAAIAKQGSPRGRESARDYRLRLAKAALDAAEEVRLKKMDELFGLGVSGDFVDRSE